MYNIYRSVLYHGRSVHWEIIDYRNKILELIHACLGGGFSSGQFCFFDINIYLRTCTWRKELIDRV